MSAGLLRRLLTKDATVLRRGVGAADRYGTAQPTWTAVGDPLPCRLEQTDAEEVTVGADTQTSDWRLITVADADIDGLDRVLVDGRTFEVVGPPAVHHTPAGAHHVEARLRHIAG